MSNVQEIRRQEFNLTTSFSVPFNRMQADVSNKFHEDITLCITLTNI